MGFKDLKFVPWEHVGNGGIRAVLDFPNGYSVSVIKGPYTYGGPEKYEMAILRGKIICYDTGITEDVLGHLSPKEVTDYMHKVEALKAKKRK